MIKVKMNVISVEDYERAKDFYTTKLGFNVVTDAKFGEDQRWIELQIPGADTRIALFRSSDEHKPSLCSNIIFGCSNVQEQYQELSSKGVTFTQPPKQESWGVSSMFQDTEGNIFCLSSEA